MQDNPEFPQSSEDYYGTSRKSYAPDFRQVAPELYRQEHHGLFLFSRHVFGAFAVGGHWPLCRFPRRLPTGRNSSQTATIISTTGMMCTCGFMSSIASGFSHEGSVSRIQGSCGAKSLERLISLYGSKTPEKADVLVAVGDGDGFMLQAMHAHMGLGKPFFGMNGKSLGFLMNDCVPGRADGSPVAGAGGCAASSSWLPWMRREEETVKHAINEVALFRPNHADGQDLDFGGRHPSPCRNGGRRCLSLRPPAVRLTIFPPTARSFRWRPDCSP